MEPGSRCRTGFHVGFLSRVDPLQGQGRQTVVVVDIVLRGNVQENPLQKRLVTERIIGCHLLHGIVPQVIPLHVVEHPLLELLSASERDLRFVIAVRRLPGGPDRCIPHRSAASAVMLPG